MVLIATAAARLRKLLNPVDARILASHGTENVRDESHSQAGPYEVQKALLAIIAAARSRGTEHFAKWIDGLSRNCFEWPVCDLLRSLQCKAQELIHRPWPQELLGMLDGQPELSIWQELEKHPVPQTRDSEARVQNHVAHLSAKKMALEIMKERDIEWGSLRRQSEEIVW